MRASTAILATGLLLSGLAAPGLADGREPGSVLIFPVHRSDGFYTIVSVTNTNLDPVNGTTNAHYQYVNVLPGSNPFHPTACLVTDITEVLTALDTRSVMTACHNADQQEGYLVVSAQDPNEFKTDWDHDYLVGSALVVSGTGGMYDVNAIPFEALRGHHNPTDDDDDGQLDFDGNEYEGIASELYIDNFLAVSNSSLALIAMSGGTAFTTTVCFDIFNDDEVALSATHSFKCWFEEPLETVSLNFSEGFLDNNTPDDETDLDIDCNQEEDFETGWARIRGKVACSDVECCPDPAILGAITAGSTGKKALVDGGRLLWESEERNFSGDFLKFGADDPEWPPVPMATRTHGIVYFLGDDESNPGLEDNKVVAALMRDVVDNSLTETNGFGVLAVGVNGGDALAAFNQYYADSGIVEPVTFVTTINEIQTVDFTDYKLVYIPSTTGLQATGGIRPNQHTALRTRQLDLRAYLLTLGGGMVCMSQAGNPFDYDWLWLPLETQNVSAANAEPTQDLTDLVNSFFPGMGPGAGDIADEEWHNVFTGPPGLFQFDTFALLNNDAPCIIGGRVLGSIN